MLERFWYNYSVRYFVAVTAVLAVVFFGWAATGRPFPGQRLGVSVDDLNRIEPAATSLGFAPEVPGSIDPRDYVPTSGFSGLAASYAGDNGLRVVLFVGIDRADPRPDMVESATSRPWALASGERYGYAVVWKLAGHRYAGMALWVPQDLVPPDDLIPRLLEATAKVGGPGPQDQR